MDRIKNWSKNRCPVLQEQDKLNRADEAKRIKQEKMLFSETKNKEMADSSLNL
jgi:hypothetical protein